MYILGLHGNFGRSDHDGASALIRDGEIIAVAEEERFLKLKISTRALRTLRKKGLAAYAKEAGIDLSRL